MVPEGKNTGGSQPKVAVIDDDHASCRLTEAIFKREDCRVVVAHDGEAGLALVAAESPDVVLLDMHLPDMDGLAVLERLSSSAPSLPVVMLTGDTDLKNAVRATRLGAYDYLTKPIAREDVVRVVRRAIETHALRVELEELRRQVGGNSNLASLMGPSTQVRKVIEQVQIVGDSRFTVLVLGETGTGKELVAQAIHRASERRDGPFVALDCGAIPENLLESELFGHEKGSFTGADRKKTGQFQLAEGGTLFLDEVGNLPSSLQAKLLRVLESQQVQAIGASRSTPLNVRFVAATNEDLQSRVASGQFRADLYFRLAQYPLYLPTLRSRPDDIPYLAHRFAEEVSVELRRPVRDMAPDALRVLVEHSWPGNVRELRNVVRQAVLRTTDMDITAATIRSILAHADVIATPRAVPTEPAASRPDSGREARPEAPFSRPEPPSGVSQLRSLREIADDAARTAEREAIMRTLRTTGGNKSEAARALKTDYKTLHVKMKSLGINARDFQS